MKIRSMFLAMTACLGALPVNASWGQGQAPAGENHKVLGQVAGTLEAVDIKKGTVTIAISEPTDGDKIKATDPQKRDASGVIRRQIYHLAKNVQVTICSISRQLSDLKNATRISRKPMPGRDNKHGLSATLKLADDGKTVTSIHVLEMNAEFYALDLKKQTITVGVREKDIYLGGLILASRSPHTYNLSNDIKVTLSGKEVKLSDVKQFAKEAWKPDPKCGCRPAGAELTMNLSVDGKTVTAMNVQPSADQSKPTKDKQGEK